MLFLVETIDERVTQVIPFNDIDSAKGIFFQIGLENTSQETVKEGWNDGILPALFIDSDSFNSYSLQLVKS